MLAAKGLTQSWVPFIIYRINSITWSLHLKSYQFKILNWQIGMDFCLVLGNCQQVLDGHTDEIFSCVFNYEGDTILTGSKDNTCRIWR